ncbi:hypothetical protein AB205_0020570 [Aquarana catesbeiana]|uniref:Uncharacterized protein n=1 Tax=Aquarana catesbeiana TaxID=8400 RepID=A0A2G9QEB5_AQUCT|nr:hypothetical protein AB205_0020570 [Aquarana catesbeiana]
MDSIMGTHQRDAPILWIPQRKITPSLTIIRKKN